ncbi:tetratricopeptide repeat protein [uncultured Alsobacter sp.]|uniref:tetratricopeptide repeat protein n=1 Tax=uncultured Alsobacter sp. TaxID=1748258 RepID=UPI0025D592D2|nr:tetratricopeptide repeat protein [uncultured Alsobacter sp.]
MRLRVKGGREGMRGSARALVLALAILTAAPQAQAQNATAVLRGTEMNGYARAVFTFDTLPKATVRVSNGILIVAFDKPVSVSISKLQAELPSYVSAVRLDPDGRGVRMALARPVRPNMMEAGEQLFLDLLPETWKQAPPALPQEVVDDLSRRAREAEEIARRLMRKKASEEPRDLAFRIGTTPTFTRVIFEVPAVAPVSFKRDGEAVELLFDSNLKIDAGRLKSVLPASVKAVEAVSASSALRLTLTVPTDVDVRGFREDETYVVDIPTAKPAPKPEANAAAGAAKPDPKAAGKPAGDHGPETAARPPVEGREPAKGEAAAVPPAPTTVTRTAAAPAGAKAEDPFAAADEKTEIKVGVAAERGSVRLTMPIPVRTPVAVFERAGTVWVAVETKATFDPSQIGLVAPGVVGKPELRRAGRLSIMRLPLSRPVLVRAAATDAGWTVTLGDDIAGSSEPLTFTRDADADGRTVVRSVFKDVSGVHWVDDPDVGDKIAIVTGRDAVHSVIKPATFVDFKALPTAQGMAITPFADDLVVKSGIDEVLVTKDGGLSVSLLVDRPEAATGTPLPKLTFDRAQWSKDRSGNVRERGRELMRIAADAPKRQRSDARVALARYEIANGLAPEAMGTIGVAMADDTELAREKQPQIVAAVAAIMANRVPEAAKLLAVDTLKDDQEGQLWRAYTDALQRRWPQSLANFRRSGSLLTAYPEDLQGLIGPAYAEAAIEGRDFGLAQRVLETLDGLDPENVDRERLRLLAARIAEGQGRVEEAAQAYDDLSKKANRPVEARARLYKILLALRDRSIERKAAIAALESLSVSWRGDEVEAKALGQLGRLYADEGRWRDAFTMARRANELFPDNDEARTLYEEAGSRFEALFLDNKADQIPRLDALALYFDFKEFTPPGRRGDEMIRRLAERLISLDLLGEASDLLQYQVDNRLSGAGKATVASRLAVIYLMNRQPAKAYQALRDSRIAELPAEIKRSRALLEARALSDLSRSDLALELVAGEEGPEVERLRADIQWQGRRWREAGEQFERIVGDAWQGAAPLDESQRADVLRAAIAYGIADDTLSLERLRAKFAPKMADSFDNRAFAVVTAPSGARAAEYRELARSIASADTLSEFLTEYRKRYPDPPAGPRRQPGPPAGAPPAPGAPPAASGAATPAAPAAEGAATAPEAGKQDKTG